MIACALPAPARQTLRPYQLEAIEALRREIRAGARSILLVAPTGSGKTSIAAEMIHSALAKGKRIVFLAHRKELIDQCSARLDGLGVPHGVIMADHWRRRPGLQVQVASVPTLVNRELRESPDLLFIDETHRARASSYQQILARYPQAICIGLTATPIRGDGKGLGNLFTALVQCPSVAQLTEMGFLVPTRVYAPARPDLRGVKKSAGDYNLGALGHFMDRKVLVGDIVDHWQRLADNRLTVVFAVTIEHSQHITEQFRQAGVAAAHLDGTTPKPERERLLAQLAAGEIRVLSNVGVLTEGWDCPQVSCIVLARPTMSMGLYLQMAGRTLRPADGKTDALILDHAGCTLMHGFVDDERDWQLSEDRIKPKIAIDTEENVKVCPDCGRAYPRAQQECECGYVFNKRDLTPDQEAGELVDATAQRAKYQAITMERRRAMYAMWRDECRFRGYKPGYPAAKYKAMFGTWPPREWDARQAATMVPRDGMEVVWPGY